MLVVRVKEIRGNCPVKEGDKACIQCLDPGKPYTDGGTVIFEVLREKE